MSTALYRRYRPDSFAEMIGQEHVTGPLMQALRSNRVNHAYLFSGPRGCGKTTSARILARILNCAQNTEGSPTDTPCGECPSCVELARGGSGSLDVVEIDAASHGGVDDARDLRERATFSPTRDRFKIFILDEAHMVTAQGFNALLKIVEEPPSYLKFIFATTEPEKVIGTIRSRTHHYPFKLVAPETMHNYLVELCAAEGITAADGVLQLVVRSGGGSVRDTLSVLDQLIAGAAGGVLEYDQAAALLGFTPSTLLDEVVESLGSRNGGQLFRVIDQIISTGHEPRRFVEDLLERLRDLLVLSLSGEAASNLLPSMPSDQLSRMQAQAGSLGVAELSRSADVVNAALTEMSGATSPRLHLELLCARLLLPTADSSASGLGARIDGIERAISSGVTLAAPASAKAVGAGHASAPAPSHGQVPVTSLAAPEPAQSAPDMSVSVQDPAQAPRKSLRPDSTRRKPAETTPTVPAQASSPMAPGSMFGNPSAATDVFSPAQPAQQTVAAPTDAEAPVAPLSPVTSVSPVAQPVAPKPQTAPQIQPTRPITEPEPEVPSNVGQFTGPRDEEGRPLAANTGWHTASSRSPQASVPASAPVQGVPALAVPVEAASAEVVPAQEAQVPVAPVEAVPVTPEVEIAAQPPVPTQVPTSSTAGETEAFILRWPEVLEAMGGLNRATTALVSQHAQVVHLDSKNLYVAVSTEPLLRTLSGRNGEQLIAAAVKEKLGFDVTVLADVEGSPRFPKAGSSADAPVAAIASETTHTPADNSRNDEHTDPLPPLPSTQWERSDYVPESGWNVEPQQPAQAQTHQPAVVEPAVADPVVSQTELTRSDAVQSAWESSANSAGSAPEPVSSPVEPDVYDPMESVSIFGAAIGALASARSVAAPELPRIGEAATQVTETIRRGPAPLPTSSPEAQPAYEPEFASVPDVPVSAPTPAEEWSAPEPPNSYEGQQDEAQPHSPATVPPWEDSNQASLGPNGETPRQAAARRAAELAAREAKRAVVVDDPQPDDDDLDTNNLVGVPLVISMFGAKVIEEITNA